MPTTRTATTPQWLTRVQSAQRFDGQIELLAPLDFLDWRGRIWRVPAESVNDGSSIPWFARSLMPRWDLILGSGALHDHPYRTGTLEVSDDGGETFKQVLVNRGTADRLWYEGTLAEQRLRWNEEPTTWVPSWRHFARWRPLRALDVGRRHVQMGLGWAALRVAGWLHYTEAVLD